jgi:hypothetical protein
MLAMNSLAVLDVMFYVITSFSLMKIAKKTETKHIWFAWIPVINLILVAKMARMQWWPVFLNFIYLIILPIGFILDTFGFEKLAIWYDAINFIEIYIFICLLLLSFYTFFIIWLWKICVKLQRPGWWAIIIAILYFILGSREVPYGLSFIMILVHTRFDMIIQYIIYYGSLVSEIALCVFALVLAYSNLRVEKRGSSVE